jgi:hypothetical protein
MALIKRYSKPIILLLVLGVVLAVKVVWSQGVPVPLRSLIFVEAEKEQYVVDEVIVLECRIKNSYPFPVRYSVIDSIEKHASISGESVNVGGEITYIDWVSNTAYLKAHEEVSFLYSQMVFLAKRPGVVTAHFKIGCPSTELDIEIDVAIVVEE